MTAVRTRIYVPLTVEALRRLDGDGALEPGVAAYAVTGDLRREHPGVDAEELEYLAFVDAAQSSADSAPVVAAADVDADSVAEDLAAGKAVSAVRVLTSVPRSWVASFHVAEASPDGTGVDGIPDYSWYDATELEAVLDLLA